MPKTFQFGLLPPALVNRSAFHHEIHCLQRADIRERISANGDDVSEFSGLDRADVFDAPEQVGGA
jgi:hypothetical protein